MTTASAPSPKRGGGHRLTRQQKSERTRRALFDAAARLVGRFGYAGASISRITSEAKVAQGTFYIYFESRQDLLDQLLPNLGEAFVTSIRNRVMPIRNGVDREEERLRAFFDYAYEHPEFFRILHEAEMFAPKAHRRHLINLERGYVHALKASWLRGEMLGFDENDLEALTYILMAARDYLAMRYSFWDGKPKRLPERVILAYMKLMRHGLFGGTTNQTQPAPDETSGEKASWDAAPATKRSSTRARRASLQRKLV